MKLNLRLYYKDDNGNHSITRMGFFITLIFILIYSTILFFMEINGFHIQILYALIAWNLVLGGLKNHKDFLQKEYKDNGRI